MSSANPLRVVVKALILFAVLNVSFAVLHPAVGRLSIYNWLVKGRQRFPVGKPNAAHNTSVDDLDALFASHVISNGPRSSDEYRVTILGDSQLWGRKTGLSETLVGQLNRAKVAACGRQMRFYNLGYPVPSVLRDFLVLNKALDYKPDLLVWMVTTNSFSPWAAPRYFSPFALGTDPREISKALQRYGPEQYSYLAGPSPNLWERTLIGQRSELSKLILLQAPGILWAATGIDNVIGRGPFSTNLSADENYSTLPPPRLPIASMTFDVLKGANQMVGDTPVLIVNEPIYIGLGQYSDIRYNNTYPRRAYDQYRQVLPGVVAELGWQYADLYNVVPSAEFADQELHLKKKGEEDLMKSLLPEILRTACP